MSRAAETLTRMRALPVSSVDNITRGGCIMILAPHPDDESLGCGGLIAESCNLGQPPVVVILTDGTGSHPSSPSYPPSRLRALREGEARRAVSILGLPASRLHFLRLRDTATPRCGPAFNKAVASIADLVRSYDCKLLCAPWVHDPHGDHEATHLIARAVANVTRAKLFSYPVWGWLLPEETDLPDEPISGWRLDIAPHLGLKRRAIAAHASQYTDLISDDPNAFRLSTKLLSALLDSPYEVLLRCHE